MNKIIFLLFLFSATLTNQRLIAQNPGTTLDGFLDLRWGDNSETVKRKMFKRDGIVFDVVQSNKERMVLKGGMFAGEKVHKFAIYFHDNRFFSVMVFLDDIECEYFIQKLWSIKSTISDKYSKPLIDIGLFKSKSCHELNIIERETAGAEWCFIAKRKDTCAIFLNVFPIQKGVQYGLKLMYQNMRIANEYLKKDFLFMSEIKAKKH
jgi:hypothetical protein